MRITILIIGAIAMGLVSQAQTDVQILLDTSSVNVSIDTSVVDLESLEQISIVTSDAEGKPITREFILKDKQPFFKKTWFILLASLLVAFTFWLVYRFITNRSRKAALAEARTAHLERSALQAQMNPHFIFNSLNSIQSYIANNENDRANRFLAKFSRLIRAMLNHSRAQMVTLEEEIVSLKLYLELEKMRFKEKFDFDIVMDEDIDTHDIMVPPLLIQPYLENALIHGLAQTRSQGKINLYYILDGKYLLVTVTDNGIGIEASKKLNKDRPSMHKSVGMSITQKRLELLDEGNTDRKVHIEEIKDRKGEVLGTKVQVKVRVR